MRTVAPLHGGDEKIRKSPLFERGESQPFGLGHVGRHCKFVRVMHVGIGWRNVEIAGDDDIAFG